MEMYESKANKQLRMLATVISPVTRILYGGVHFGSRWTFAIIVVIKQSDWDYRVNKVFNVVVTCPDIVDSTKWV